MCACSFDLLLRPATTSYLFPVRERFQISSIPDLTILAAANSGSQGKHMQMVQALGQDTTS